MVLAAAVVLDPRYKIRAVEIAYTKIYGKDEGAQRTKQVLDTLRALFEEYKEESSSNLDTPISQAQQNVDSEADGLDPYAIDLDTINASLFVEKSELDLYLEEPLIDRKQEIDILMWWKSLLYRSPSLVRLARDVLSIPITSVASESAFSVGGRILKPTRSSLTSESVEALICTRNWIFGLKEEHQGDVDALTEEMTYLDLNASTSERGSNEPLQVD